MDDPLVCATGKAEGPCCFRCHELATTLLLDYKEAMALLHATDGMLGLLVHRGPSDRDAVELRELLDRVKAVTRRKRRTT